MNQSPLQPTPVGALRFNTDTSNLEYYDGNQWVNITSSNYQEAGSYGGSARGLVLGGSPGQQDTIEYININRSGNSTDFGNLTTGRRAGPGSTASRIRAICYGGQEPGFSNVIDYGTIASTGNFSDFGDMSGSGREFGGGGNDVRGIIWGQAGPSTNRIEYVTIAHTGNSIDFGDCSTTGGSASGQNFGSPTRSIFSGGYYAATDCVNIASTGNAARFGDAYGAPSTNTYGLSGQTGNATRGLVMGGNFMGNPWTQFQSHVGAFTISTFGNGYDFGDLSAARAYGGQCSSTIRSVFMGGYNTPARVDIIESNSNSTAGTAVDFGNLTAARSACTGTSNGHGGLG